jgi:hypothetical protein
MHGPRDLARRLLHHLLLSAAYLYSVLMVTAYMPEYARRSRDCNEERQAGPSCHLMGGGRG